MRTKKAQDLAQSRPDDYVTTGEAATIIGTSRQHIVDLCMAGDLPFTLVGKHRRILTSDLAQLKNASTRMTRDQQRSLLLAYAVAGRLVLDPETGLNVARRNLDKMRSTSPRGAARVWIDTWQKLIDGPLPALLDALTSRAVRSRELRQNSPFAGLLSEEERARVVAHLQPAGMRPRS